MEIRIDSLADLPQAAETFFNAIGDAKVFAFNAEMGNGKTTFISALLNYMGITELEGSPTYSLVNIYESDQYGKIHHFDLYRIESEEEAFDIGIEEMLYSNHFCFIEWPDKIENLLPEGTKNVSIRLEGEKRVIVLE